MRIAVDIDNVLVDDVGSFCRFHNDKYNTNLSKERFYTWNWWIAMNEPKENVVKKHGEYVKSDYFKNIDIIPGAKEGIENLKNKHELVILTGRPKRLMKETKIWLAKNFGSVFREIYCTDFHLVNGTGKNKGTYIVDKKIDVLIDDYIEHGKECPVSTKVLLFDCPWNQNKVLPENFIRVLSWPEIVATIEQINNV